MKKDIIVTQYNYVFGGKDSCNGDSGGPLWVWMRLGNETRMRGVQIGVVSRGDGCAKVGSPGVYSRVKKLVHWLMENASDGNCN